MNCSICGEPAGFLRSQHDRCAQRRDESLAELGNLMAAITPTTLATTDWDFLQRELDQRAHYGNIGFDVVEGMIAGTWRRVVQQKLQHGLVSPDEEKVLETIAERFGLSDAVLDEDGARSRLRFNAVLRQVLTGNPPEWPEPTPFNLRGQERMVWLFHKVKYYEDRVRHTTLRESHGNYGGASLRIARGIYYHAGSFGATSVATTTEQQVRVYVDSGTLGLTTENLYFASRKQSLRLPYDKIVTFTPNNIGIRICREGASAKPQTFYVSDPWFAHNLLVNLARLSRDEKQIGDAHT